jgi:hypothetical protein
MHLPTAMSSNTKLASTVSKDSVVDMSNASGDSIPPLNLSQQQLHPTHASPSNEIKPESKVTRKETFQQGLWNLWKGIKKHWFLIGVIFAIVLAYFVPVVGKKVTL